MGLFWEVMKWLDEELLVVCLLCSCLKNIGRLSQPYQKHAKKYHVPNLTPQAPKKKFDHRFNFSNEDCRASGIVVSNAIMNISQPVPSAIGSVDFGFLSSSEIKSLSVKKIENPTTFDTLLHPVPGGLYDPALGAWGDVP